jgi:hypothetical protein
MFRRTKSALFLIAFMSCVAGCDKPPSNRYAAVSISTADGYSIRIMADGSGRTGFGALDLEQFPPGTFDFDEVIRTLERTVEKQRRQPDEAAVAFWKDGDTSVIAQYSHDMKTIRELIDKGRAAARAAIEAHDRAVREGAATNSINLAELAARRGASSAPSTR